MFRTSAGHPAEHPQNLIFCIKSVQALNRYLKGTGNACSFGLPACTDQVTRLTYCMRAFRRLFCEQQEVKVHERQNITLSGTPYRRAGRAPVLSAVLLFYDRSDHGRTAGRTGSRPIRLPQPTMKSTMTSPENRASSMRL